LTSRIFCTPPSGLFGCLSDIVLKVADPYLVEIFSKPGFDFQFKDETNLAFVTIFGKKN
jgi:hypothetical protein